MSFVEGGLQKDVYDYPANYSQIGRTASGGRVVGCTLDLQARNLCTPVADSLASWDPLVEASPFRTGSITTFGASVSGGGDIASYFVSGDLDRNDGVYDPNHFNRTSLRATLRERAYWLYLTSHRLGDLRRLITQYNRSAESVFPTGTYHKSGTYGTDVNTPVPQAEENNPNFKRSECVVTTA